MVRAKFVLSFEEVSSALIQVRHRNKGANHQYRPPFPSALFPNFGDGFSFVKRKMQPNCFIVALVEREILPWYMSMHVLDVPIPTD